jgi:hypothetical protein
MWDVSALNKLGWDGQFSLARLILYFTESKAIPVTGRAKPENKVISITRPLVVVVFHLLLRWTLVRNYFNFLENALV